jgi:hypothetical protein
MDQQRVQKRVLVKPRGGLQPCPPAVAGQELVHFVDQGRVQVRELVVLSRRLGTGFGAGT